MAQIIANFLLAASHYLLLGLGFLLIYRVGGFFHVAHGAVFTLGAYGLYLFAGIHKIGLWWAMPLAVLGTALVGLAIGVGIHRPLRQREATPVIHLIASLGIYIAMTNILAIFFGDQSLTLHDTYFPEGMLILGAHLTLVQMFTIVTAGSTTLLVAVLLNYTSMGILYRAVVTDRELAVASGLPVEGIINGAFMVGSAIASVAGMLVAMDIDVRPTMGLSPLLLAVVAVIVGGLRNLWGVVGGAILIAIVESVASWFLSQHWKDTTVFVLLILFLLVRPQGLAGHSGNKG